MSERKWEVWVGAYARPGQVGITRLELDGESGELAKTSEYAGIENPSYLAMSHGGTVLYAVSETMETDDAPGGRLIAYPVDLNTRKLGPGWERLTHGGAPCHVSLDSAGQWLAVANYFGSAVTLYMLGPDGKPSDALVRLRHTGKGANPQRQEQPHPHSAVFDPQDDRYLYVPDLGLDQIMIYEKGDDGFDWRIAGSASLAAADGPRHLAFHPGGGSAYLVNELSSSVTRFVRREAGKLERQETVSAVPPSFSGENTCAEIVVSPDGRFVYVSNRGHNSIAVFRLDEATGQLGCAGHVSTRGQNPRNFSLTPDGLWLLAANQGTDNLVLFKIDANTGLPVFHRTQISVSKPVCVLIRDFDA